MTTDNPNARLEALGGMTAETEAANPGPEQQQQQAKEQAEATEAETAARQWGMLMFTVGGFAQMIEPGLKQVYTEDRCYAWGQQANAVAEKYGWNGPSAMPELALIASTAGFLVPTYFMVKARMKAAQHETGPASWVAKMGLWWRTRKARGKAESMVTPAPEGETRDEN